MFVYGGARVTGYVVIILVCTICSPVPMNQNVSLSPKVKTQRYPIIGI